MSDAPERIWTPSDPEYCTLWPNAISNIEWVRADRIKALEAERDALAEKLERLRAHARDLADWLQVAIEQPFDDEERADAEKDLAAYRATEGETDDHTD